MAHAPSLYVLFAASLALTYFSTVAFRRTRNGGPPPVVNPSIEAIIAMVMNAIITISAFNVEVPVAPPNSRDAVVYEFTEWGFIGVGFIFTILNLLLALNYMFKSMEPVAREAAGEDSLK